MAEFGEFLINNMKTNLQPEYNDIINRKIQLYPKFDELDSLDSLNLDKMDRLPYSSSTSSSSQIHYYINDYEYNNLNNSLQKNFYENDNKCQEVIKSIRLTNQMKNISNNSLHKLDNKTVDNFKMEPNFNEFNIINNKVIKKEKKRRSIDDKTRVCKITRKGFMPKKFKYSITQDSQEPFLNFYLNKNNKFSNEKQKQPSLKYLDDNFLVASGNFEKTWINLTKKYYVNRNTCNKNTSIENNKQTNKLRGINLTKILNHPTGLKNFLVRTFNKTSKFKGYNKKNESEQNDKQINENSNFLFLKKSNSELNIANYKPLLISSQEKINSHSSSSSNSSNNFLTSIQSLNPIIISSSTYSKSTPTSIRSMSKSESGQHLSTLSTNSQRETLNPLYRSTSAIFNNENDKNEIEITENNIIDDENTVATTINNNLNKVTTLTTMNTTTTLINTNNNDKISYNIKNDDHHIYENATNSSSNTQIKLTFCNSSRNNNNELTKTSNLLISSCTSDTSNNSKSLRPTVKFEINQLLAENNCQIIDNSCKKKNNNNSKKIKKNTNPTILNIKKLINNSKKIKKNLYNIKNKMNQKTNNEFNRNTDINMYKMMHAFKILLNDSKNSDNIHQIIKKNIILNSNSNNKQKANQQLRQLLQQQLKQQNKNITSKTNNKQQQLTTKININNTNKLNTKVINSLIKNNNIVPNIIKNANNSAKKINNRANSIDSSYLHQQNATNQQINKQKRPSFNNHKPSLTSSNNNNSYNYHQIDSNQIYSIISVEKSKVLNNNKSKSNNKRNIKKNSNSSLSSSTSDDSTSASIESFTSHQSKNFYNLQQSNDNTLDHSNHDNTRNEIIKQQVRLIKKKHHFHEQENIYSNNTKLFDKFNLFSVYYNKMKTKNNTSKTDSTNSLITSNSITNENYQYKSKLTPVKAKANSSPSEDSKHPASTSSSNNYQPLIQNNINKQKLLSSWDKVIKKASKDPSSIEKMLKSKSFKSSSKKKNNINNNNNNICKANTLQSNADLTNTELNSENKDIVSQNSGSGLSNNMSRFFKNFKNKNRNKKFESKTKKVYDNSNDDNENRYEKIKTDKNVKKEDLNTAVTANDDYNKEKINEILLSGVVTAGKQGELIKCLFSYLNSYGDDGFTIKQQQPSNNINLPDFKNMNESPLKLDINKKQKQNELQPPPPPPIQTLPLTSISSDSSKTQTSSSEMNLNSNVMQKSDSSASQSSGLNSSFDNTESVAKTGNEKKITTPSHKSIFPFYLKCCMERKLGSRSTIGSGKVEIINNDNIEHTSITENDANTLNDHIKQQPAFHPIKLTKEASTSNTDLSIRICDQVNLERVKEEVSNIENKFKRKDNSIDIDNLIETLDHAGQIDYLRKKLSVYLKSKNNDKKLIEDLTNITASITSNSIYEKHNNKSDCIEKNLIYSSNKMLNNDDHKTKNLTDSNKRNSLTNNTNTANKKNEKNKNEKNKNEKNSNNKNENNKNENNKNENNKNENNKNENNKNENNNNTNNNNQIINDLKNTKNSRSYLDLYGDESQFIYDNKGSNNFLADIVSVINKEKNNKPNKLIKKEKKADTQIELKIVKDDINEIKSSLKEANEMKQIMKLIESKESKFARLREKIEANRLAAAEAAKKKKSIRSYKTTDQLDLDMFYFTSESPTRPTMKTRTQKFLSGFYKQLTGNKSGTSYSSISKPEFSSDLFASDMDKETMKKFKTINKIKNKNDGTFYFRIIPNNEEEKTEIITIKKNEKYPVVEKDQPFFVKKFNSVVSNLDKKEMKVCSSNLELFESEKGGQIKNESLPISTEMKVEVINKINVDHLPAPVSSAKKQSNIDDTIRKYEKLMPKEYISDSDDQKHRKKLVLNGTIKGETKLNRFKSDLFQSRHNNKSKQSSNSKYDLKAIKLKSKQVQNYNQDKKIKKKLRSNSVKKEIKYIQTKPNALANPINIRELISRSQKEIKNTDFKTTNQKNNSKQSPTKQQKTKQPISVASKITKPMMENRNSTTDLNANFKRRQSKRAMAKPIIVNVKQDQVKNNNNNKNKTQNSKLIKEMSSLVEKKSTNKLLNKLLQKNPTLINNLAVKDSSTVNQPIMLKSNKNKNNKQIERGVPSRLSKRNTSTPIGLNKYRMSGRKNDFIHFKK